MSHNDPEAVRDDGDGKPVDAPLALDGEAGIPSVDAPTRPSVSRKGLLAIGLLAVSLVAASAVSIQRALSSAPKEETSKRLGERPTAAGTEPRRLDLSLPIASPAPASAAPAGTRIPAISPLPEDQPAQPIPLRASAPQRPAPEDAPAVLLSSRATGIGKGASARPATTSTADASSDPADPLDRTRRNLDAYQQQLQGLLDTLTKSTDLATRQDTTAAPPAPRPFSPTAPAQAQTNGLFGGQLQASATPRTVAGLIHQRSLTLAKGTAFTCALKTRLVSAASGFVSCQVQRNVYSEDGRVLLIERGSHLDGEYRSTAVRPGTVRIPVLWTRIRTPNAVTVDIDSPGTGALGESGIDGYVDNRWVERIGAAMLLSLIDDSVRLIASSQLGDGGDGTVVLSSTTSSTSKLAEKVLDSTINIPPLIYQNQGAIVGIYVARDVDFSSVYELKAVER